MRVLILAEDCNPEWPATPSFAFCLSRAISKLTDVMLATQIRNRQSIERAGFGNGKVFYVNTEKIARPLWRIGVFLRGGVDVHWGTQAILNYPGSLAFEWCARKHFHQDLQKKRYDLIHRLTPVSTRQPSLIAKSCSVPFLLGPINGSLPWPTIFSGKLTKNEAFVRKWWNACRLLPFYRTTMASATGILASCNHTIADLPDYVKSKTINFPNVGIDPKMFTMPTRSHQKQMTILFVGRLVPVKLPEVLIHAFAASEILRRHKLIVVGDGPERSKLEEFIKENNLKECVQLTGQKSHSEVAELMRLSDVFAFPSICETGGAVIVEAMACGMACIVVDYGGPGTLIGQDRGIKIPMGDLIHLVKRFKEELEYLVLNPKHIELLGSAAHHHAMKYYSWDAKAKKIIEIYEWITGQRKTKPYFWDQ